MRPHIRQPNDFTRSDPDRDRRARPTNPRPSEPPTPAVFVPHPALDPTRTEEAIRARAYQLWEAAGRPDGDGVNFWLQAEREVRGR